MNKYNIMSFENALHWSWGNAIQSLIDKLSDYNFVRVERFQVTEAPREMQQKPTVHTAPIPKELVNHFDVTLLQNCDSIALVKGNKKRVVARLGGLVMDTNKRNDRYNDQLFQCGAVIACNEELADIARPVNENTFVVPNGCDLDLFKPCEGEKEHKGFVVGFVGNIHNAGADYKGWQYFVQATEIELYNEVQKTYILHGSNDVPNHEMPTFFHGIDCLVMPSVNEGCSNTIKEALACGVPVLCTKVGYHGEMLIDGENVVFIERDVKDIVEKIMMLKNDYSLREKLSFNGRLFAEMYHDINKVAKEYDRIFQMVIQNNLGV